MTGFSAFAEPLEGPHYRRTSREVGGKVTIPGLSAGRHRVEFLWVPADGNWRGAKREIRVDGVQDASLELDLEAK